ncbi:hypothetical protein A9168_03910 [Macellibacteroides sp. HH-ZS]|nr:hypothetical protein A9168_03910 [Macellibacteroides sp. HH-ZS]
MLQIRWDVYSSDNPYYSYKRMISYLCHIRSTFCKFNILPIYRMISYPVKYLEISDFYILA